MATLALVALTTVSVQATPLPSAKTRWRRHAGPDGCSRVDLSGKSELFRLKLTRFRGARQAFNGGFSDAQDASALFT